MRFIPLPMLLAGWLALPAHAADAQDWLHRMNAAEQVQSFQGTFVYQRSGSFSTHGIWHRVDDDGTVRERLLRFDGPAQEVLKLNGHTECVRGAEVEQLSAEQAWPSRAFDPGQLQNWYELRLLGESRVAGRPVAVIAVQPRDQHRYGFELYLDRETGLLLKSLLLGDGGQLLERFQFASFDTRVPDAADLQVDPGCRPVRLVEVGQARVEWRSEWLPAGFRLNSVLEHESPLTRERVTCLTYGDGLARFSVFLEEVGPGTVVEDARSQFGPTVAVSRRVPMGDLDMMVTVIGEIPLGTAELVALSMRSGGER